MIQRGCFSSFAYRNIVQLAHKSAALAARPISTAQIVPGSDPLEVLRKECIQRGFCDDDGFRRPGVHWTFCIAIPFPDEPGKAPSLRTLNVQHISEAGVDFVMRRGSGTCEILSRGSSAPVSFLHVQGDYVPGEISEQWRGEGHCGKIPLDLVLDKVPHYTITSMVGSKRIENENIGQKQPGISEGHRAMRDRNHVKEVMQRTRIELENGDIDKKELKECMRAFRFYPDRLECMYGGPDTILWQRWEWLRDESVECPEGSIPWADPQCLMPH